LLLLVLGPSPRRIFSAITTIVGFPAGFLQARVEIWDYMSYHIEERPVLGWGLMAAGLSVRKPHVMNMSYTTYSVGHPHIPLFNCGRNLA